MSPPAVLVIENLHLFIGNSDKLKQFVIDGFRWEVKEQMSFMVLLTRLKKLISVCRCCQSFTWCCPNSTMLQELKNTAVLPQTSMAPPAGGFHDRVNINFLSIHYISYGLLIFFRFCYIHWYLKFPIPWFYKLILCVLTGKGLDTLSHRK